MNISCFGRVLARLSYVGQAVNLWGAWAGELKKTSREAQCLPGNFAATIKLASAWQTQTW